MCSEKLHCINGRVGAFICSVYRVKNIYLLDRYRVWGSRYIWVCILPAVLYLNLFVKCILSVVFVVYIMLYLSFLKSFSYFLCGFVLICVSFKYVLLLSMGVFVLEFWFSYVLHFFFFECRCVEVVSIFLINVFNYFDFSIIIGFFFRGASCIIQLQPIELLKIKGDLTSLIFWNS